MRIAIIGCAGSGKTTLARTLAARLGLPRVELDAINWGPGWRSLYADDPAAFLDLVRAAVADEAWVIDGTYSLGLPIVVTRATDLVWLDYGRRVVMIRVIRRSWARTASGREVWEGTGNRETWRRWLDRDHPIRWAWSTFADRRRRYEALFADTALGEKRLHRLRRPSEARDLSRRLEAIGGASC